MKKAFSSHGLNLNKYQIIKALYPLTLYMQVNKNSNTNTIVKSVLIFTVNYQQHNIQTPQKHQLAF